MALKGHPSRPHFVRAAVAALLAIAGMVAAGYGDLNDDPTPTELALAVAGAAVLLLFGIFAVRSVASGVREVFDERMGPGRSAGVGLLITILGYAIVILTTLRALGLDIGGLLLGGALTGVLVGIAAQQSLGNFFAGVVLMLVRPFVVGEHVVLKSAPLGGEYEGEVADMGLFYVTIVTERGAVALPNAGVLAAAVGPGARSAEQSQEEEEQAQEAP